MDFSSQFKHRRVRKPKLSSNKAMKKQQQQPLQEKQEKYDDGEGGMMAEDVGDPNRDLEDENMLVPD